MLRINHIQTSHGTTLKLEGKLLEPWVAELRQVIDQLSGSQVVSIDLASVSYVDTAGAVLLRCLLIGGTSITGCSSFVAELLKRERA